MNNLTRTFLLPEKDIWFLFEMTDEPETFRGIVAGKDPESRLWLVGEADYVDRFGQPHTCGYGAVV